MLPGAQLGRMIASFGFDVRLRSLPIRPGAATDFELSGFSLTASMEPSAMLRCMLSSQVRLARSAASFAPASVQAGPSSVLPT